nr:hypothetical protein [Neisseria meningitidis]
MEKNRFVKYLSDSIFRNPCIEYVLDENHNYKEQYNANKDLFIYINGIQVGSISPGELQELQYCAYCPAAGVLYLLWLNTDNPEAFNRIFMMLQDPAHFAKAISGTFHLFYCISLFGTFVKLIFNQDSIFSIFNKELSKNIQSYKKLKMRGSCSMDIVAVRD